MSDMNKHGSIIRISLKIHNDVSIYVNTKNRMKFSTSTKQFQITHKLKKSLTLIFILSSKNFLFSLIKEYFFILSQLERNKFSPFLFMCCIGYQRIEMLYFFEFKLFFFNVLISQLVREEIHSVDVVMSKISVIRKTSNF